MVSGLSKLADRNFVIGFFLPALLGLVTAAAMFPKLAPLDKVSAAISSLNPDKALPTITLLVATVWLLAVVLLLFNTAIYRIFEGYLPPVRWFFVSRWVQKLVFERLSKEREQLNHDWKTAGTAFPEDQISRVMELERRLANEYPTSERELLPTAFGNRIRAFEVYPRELYGVNAIRIWFRLLAVVPSDFQQAIAAARAGVDFPLNVSALAILLCLLALASVAAVHWNVGPAQWGLASSHGVLPPIKTALYEALACAIVGTIAYAWATQNVIEWGEFVKSAFDCYLPSLAEQLGQHLPHSQSVRRTMWMDVSDAMTYRINPLPDRVPVQPPEMHLGGFPRRPPAHE